MFTLAISRSGQRLVNAVAAGNPEFILFSFDVSKALSKARATSGRDIRAVEFDAPKVDIECLRQLSDFKGYDLAKETLTMLKPMYGLNLPLKHCMKSCTRY